MGGASVLDGRKIDDTLIVDAAYRAELPWDTTLTIRVANLFDTDPSFAAWDESLKARGLNPGTSADLTVAALFIAGTAGVAILAVDP